MLHVYLIAIVKDCAEQYIIKWGYITYSGIASGAIYSSSQLADSQMGQRALQGGSERAVLA